MRATQAFPVVAFPGPRAAPPLAFVLCPIVVSPNATRYMKRTNLYCNFSVDPPENDHETALGSVYGADFKCVLHTCLKRARWDRFLG